MIRLIIFEQAINLPKGNVNLDQQNNQMVVLQTSITPVLINFLLFTLATLALGTFLIPHVSKILYKEKNYIQLSIAKRLTASSISIAFTGLISGTSVFYLNQFFQFLKS